jgi:hypothetical protein
MGHNEPGSHAPRLGKCVGEVGGHRDVVLDLVNDSQDRRTPVLREGNPTLNRVPELGDN